MIEKSGVKATITDIRWERIFLSLVVSLEVRNTDLPVEEFDYYAVDEFGKAGVKFQVIPAEKNQYILNFYL